KDEALGDVPLSIVVNRFTRHRGNTVQIKEAEEALGRKIEHFVVDDDKTVQKALDYGVPLFETEGGARLEKDIHSLITAVTERARTERDRTGDHLVGKPPAIRDENGA
ncbi:MAG: hypothetical protein ACE5LL_04595, partial [Alphaproteobacteria bacterium]